MLYPQSIKSYSRKWCGSSEGSSSSNQEEEEGKSLTKEENTEKSDSARYESLLDVKDVKDTNWLLNLDDESNHSLIFDSVFDSPPEPFSPLWFFLYMFFLNTQKLLGKIMLLYSFFNLYAMKEKKKRNDCSLLVEYMCSCKCFLYWLTENVQLWAFCWFAQNSFKKRHKSFFFFEQ